MKKLDEIKADIDFFLWDHLGCEIYNRLKITWNKRKLILKIDNDDRYFKNRDLLPYKSHLEHRYKSIIVK